ncbi:MAG: two-component system, OmpR family, alkaline phosphatase synthesis response regulator PhoP [Thermoanaerobaculia bacterium]|jgi:CheY-like chemotaxis protein|nr:two-component system, OmpR family, alkaline phosphatase synthesis response regulator PhoP [Thermoanaerobaculia bacterium]
MSEAITSLPCPTCTQPIRLDAIEWCHCVSTALSAICPSCHSCFCGKSLFPMRAEWQFELRALRERQTEEKFKRALDTAAPASNKAPTVLIVDDDEEIRLIAEYSVQQMGYRTLTAKNAEEALKVIEQSKTDIVLTDALMPKTDGRQLCRLIKLIDPSIKVIVMSSLYTALRYRTEALNTFHADDYLTKPINFDKLRAVLAKVSAVAA